jgi:two-component system cell cycle sensor histidine kinase/response regulator CckA
VVVKPERSPGNRSDGALVAELQRRLRLESAMTDGMSDLMWIKDAEGRFLSVNRALASVCGRTRDEMIGATDFDFMPKELAEAYLADDREVIRAGRGVRRLEQFADPDTGAVRWIETVKNPVYDEEGEFLGVTGVARNVTYKEESELERQRLLQELEQQHARLNDLVANVPGVVWEEAFDGSWRYVNDYVETMLGYTKAEYLTNFDSVVELIPEDDRELYLHVITAMIEENRGGTQLFRLMRKDGRVIWCESHCSMIAGPDGHPIGFRGVSMDVTERVLAEEALRESEERFRHLADAAPVMIWKTNRDGLAIFHNRSLIEFLGSSLNGNDWTALVHPDDMERVARAMMRAHVEQNFTPLELRARREDGEYRDVYLAAKPDRAHDGSFDGFIGIVVDLTEHRSLERRLEEGKRMASLGRVAATIAHEINNVLMAIQPYAEIIQREPDREVLERAAERIQSALRRGSRITHEILRYANATDPAVRSLHVASWLDANAEEWRMRVGPMIDVEIDVRGEMHVLADPVQLQQIFVNLASNAAQAMRGCGTFRIEASHLRHCNELERREDGYVHFVIEDTGPGIPEHIASRIFEPLFTTHSNGTGLGLALVHDFVMRHQGSVWVDAGRAGARFHIVLPATSSAAQNEESDAFKWPSWVRRILLVEDEEAVAEGMQILLQMDGIAADVVARGEATLDAIAASSPDLVVLDIGLPDIPGVVVFERIRQHHPELPVIFASGHSHEIENQRGEVPGPTGHILKPFDVQELIHVVRALR